jgi:DNA-binding response OmpR family regulator
MAVEQRILVIDDESDIGELISATARTLGLQCEITTNTMAFFGKALLRHDSDLARSHHA